MAKERKKVRFVEIRKKQVEKRSRREEEEKRLNFEKKKKKETQKVKFMEIKKKLVEKRLKFEKQLLEEIEKKKIALKLKSERLTIKVATLNVFEGNGRKFKEKYLEQIRAVNPEFVLMQEGPTSKEYDYFENYNYVVWRGKSDFDQMVVLQNNDSVWHINYIKDFDIITCPTKRTIEMVHVTLKKGGASKYINIANVHLCGGASDENHVTKRQLSVDEMQSVKIEALNNLLDKENRADIIAGDFNSDVQHFVTGKPNDAQKKYLVEKYHWTDGAIRTWNTAPFNLLTANGFKLVPPETATSFYKTATDCILYHPNDDVKTGNKYKITQLEHGILDMDALKHKHQEMGASDHNGVWVNFLVE